MLNLKKLSVYFAFLAYSILQTLIIFSRIPKDKFLFIGDQFIRFTLDETYRNAFYIRKMENFGVFNAWQLTIQTPEVIFYSIIHNLGLDIRTAEQVLFTTIIFLTLTLSFIGFSKLQKLLYSNLNIWIVLAVTVWYSMNPYLMVMWHGAIYNFGSSLTYSLAPLILYYFHIGLVDSKANRERLICALLMFIASFTFWMFAAIVFFLIIYLSIYLFMNRKLFVTVFVNFIKLMAVYIPMCAVIIYPILHEYFNNDGDVNGTFYATFGQIKGGLLYQALMYFSWGIYNFWSPRSIYPPVVTDFYFSPFYILSTIALYVILGIGLYNIYKSDAEQKISNILSKNYYILIFIIIFLVSIFLAKGQEPPLGGIFLFLYNHVPFFTVFRSSDHRFGFPAVLALSVLFLIVLQKIANKKVVIPVLLAAIFIQNFIFFNASLIIGQNSNNEYFDRIVQIPDTYKEVSSFLNANSETAYTFSYPSIEFGSYKLGESEVHIGQDILAKISNTNFAYIPVTSGMHIPAAKVLVASINSKNLDILKLLPIKYLLIRNDVECQECPAIDEAMLSEKTTKVFENSQFRVFEINDHTSLINSSNEITYKAINPVKFEVTVKNVQETANISLMQSYNQNWNLYIQKYSDLCDNPMIIDDATSECPTVKRPVDFSTLLANNKKAGSRAYIENLGHINSWNINSSSIASANESYYHKNSDGSYNFTFMIQYDPQKNYMWAMMISAISTLGVISWILILNIKEEQD